MTLDYQTKIHYIDEIVIQLVSLDQNTKEFVLNISFLEFLKGFSDIKCVGLHVAKTHQICCERELLYSIKLVKNTKL